MQKTIERQTPEAIEEPAKRMRGSVPRIIYTAGNFPGLIGR